MPDAETTRMLRDYMENGFLENIIDMFRADPSLWSAVPDMIADERSRVRIGTIAIAEQFASTHKDEIARVLPDIAKGLKHKEPTIRGDVVYLLSTFKIKEVLPYLEDAVLHEPNLVVKDEMEETILELKY